MFLSVKFRDDDVKTYTYEADGKHESGDLVLVLVKGEIKTVRVVDTNTPAPSFACKPIIGPAPKEVQE